MIYVGKLYFQKCKNRTQLLEVDFLFLRIIF